MASSGLGLAILSGLLGGLGQGAKQMRADDLAALQTRKLDEQLALEREKLAQQRTQFEAGRFVEMPVAAVHPAFRPAGMGPLDEAGTVRLPKEVATLSSAMLERDTKLKDERQRGANLMQTLLGMQQEAQPTTGVPPGETEPTSQVTVPGRQIPREEQIARLMPDLESGARATILQDILKPRAPVAVGSQGLYLPETGAVVGQPPPPKTYAEAEAMPTPKGMTKTIKEHPGKGFTVDFSEEKPQRTLAERYAEAKLYADANPQDPEAKRTFARLQEAMLAEERLAGARAAGAFPYRPPTESDKQVLGDFAEVESALQSAARFSEAEIKAFTGIWNRPIQEARGLLQETMRTLGLRGDVDALTQRFYEFKNVGERLRATAFLKGGKQLTPFEASVVFGYTPTGRELGGPAEYLAKVTAMNKLIPVLRELHLWAASVTREQFTAEYDSRLKAALAKSGIKDPAGGAASTPKATHRINPKTGTLEPIP